MTPPHHPEKHNPFCFQKIAERCLRNCGLDLPTTSGNSPPEYTGKCGRNFRNSVTHKVLPYFSPRMPTTTKLNRPYHPHAIPRVAILVDTSTTWGRAILAGVTNYTRTHERWQIFVEARGLEEHLQLPAGWNCDGIIARIATPRMARELRTKKFPSSTSPASKLSELIIRASTPTSKPRHNSRWIIFRSAASVTLPTSAWRALGM